MTFLTFFVNPHSMYSRKKKYIVLPCLHPTPSLKGFYHEFLLLISLFLLELFYRLVNVYSCDEAHLIKTFVDAKNVNGIFHYSLDVFMVNYIHLCQCLTYT